MWHGTPSCNFSAFVNPVHTVLSTQYWILCLVLALLKVLENDAITTWLQRCINLDPHDHSHTPISSSCQSQGELGGGHRKGSDFCTPVATGNSNKAVHVNCEVQHVQTDKILHVGASRTSRYVFRSMATNRFYLITLVYHDCMTSCIRPALCVPRCLRLLHLVSNAPSRCHAHSFISRIYHSLELCEQGRYHDEHLAPILRARLYSRGHPIRRFTLHGPVSAIFMFAWPVPRWLILVYLVESLNRADLPCICANPALMATVFGCFNDNCVDPSTRSKVQEIFYTQCENGMCLHMGRGVEYS